MAAPTSIIRSSARRSSAGKTLKGVVSKYFDNSYLGVVSSLVREEKISVDDLRELIRQIESQTEKR